MSSNAVSGTGTANSDPTASNQTQSGGTDAMFMQLLLTQLKNQDPLSPTDPSTFVQQLVQVTSLDQLTQINQLLQNSLANKTGSAGNSTSGGH